MSRLLNEAKTAFVGLDNAGKTSIIKFLERKLPKNASIKATMGAEITTQKIALLGLELYHWDFGGQLQYRESYLKNKQKYFIGVKILIFVVDVQDKDRFDEAVQYLEDILYVVEDIEQDIKFVVLFHKYDPELAFLENVDDRIERLKKKILALDPPKDISFHKTSIFNPLSIIKPFSEITIHFSEKTSQIQSLLDDFCEKTLSKSAILFDARNFILDLGARKDKIVEALEAIAHIFSTGMEELEKHALEALEIITTVRFTGDETEDARANIFIHKLDLSIKLYLVVLTTNPDTKFQLVENFKIFTEKLVNIFNA